MHYVSRLNSQSSFSLESGTETRIVMGNPARGSDSSPFNGDNLIQAPKAGTYEIEVSIEIAAQLNATDYLLIAGGGVEAIGFPQWNGETSVAKAKLTVYLDLDDTVEIKAVQTTGVTVSALNSGRANYVTIKTP